MAHLQFILGILAAIVAVYMVVRHVRVKQTAATDIAKAMFAGVVPLLADAREFSGESKGSLKLTGHYRGHSFQFTTVVDTLATRKLPSLWLLVTLAKAQALNATIDLMMRPAGPTTFSNFDFLPHTLPTPPDFPYHAIVRSDVAMIDLPTQALRGAMGLFYEGKGKELLLSPKGLRIVVQLSQADKLRYGVMREARFDDPVVDAGLATELMNTLLDLDAALVRETLA